MTGIAGFDDITLGGLPAGRPTLVCGSAGCGKTLFGIEFLVRGAVQFKEPGVFVSFEETEEELTKNVTSLGFDLEGLVAAKKLAIEHVRVERSEIEEAGDYNLDGLFIRLAAAFDAVGAKRVVLDTLESLFSGFTNMAILRAELRRLFRWLKDRGVTAVITGERGQGQLTRHGLEEYVSDCVIFLDHRVENQLSTRRLRIVKYRGSVHGTNEYPFLIDEAGFTVVPITSMGLSHGASNERISSGVARLDTMLGGRGYYRGSSVLVSGTAGTGKSSLAAAFVNAACERGERCVYFAFEESEAQIVRNMRTIGYDLGRWTKGGLLRVEATRPTLYGLEMHLARIQRAVREFAPRAVVIDPMTNLADAGTPVEATRMLMRLVDFLKSRNVTGVFVSLTHGGEAKEATSAHVSSLMDAWLLLRDIELSGERNRVLYVLKARGMAHSNQVREFRLTKHGIDLVDVYLGPEGVVTGSARIVQVAAEGQAEAERRAEIAARERTLERKKASLEAQIRALQADLAAEEGDLARLVARDTARKKAREVTRARLATSRWADERKNTNGRGT